MDDTLAEKVELLCRDDGVSTLVSVLKTNVLCHYNPRISYVSVLFKDNVAVRVELGEKEQNINHIDMMIFLTMCISWSNCRRSSKSRKTKYISYIIATIIVIITHLITKAFIN